MKPDILNTKNFSKHFHSENYGFLYRKFDKNILSYFKPKVDQILSNFSSSVNYQSELVGQIYNEYSFELPQFFVNILKETQLKFEEIFKYYATYHNLSTKKDIWPTVNYNSQVWINFQQKHEYNPIHFHTGLYSWVFWYQIPYTLSSEIKSKPPHPEYRFEVNHGQFYFCTPSYGKSGVDTYPLSCYKEDEGTLLFFPSSLNHVVYPFYSSDDFRITIAGNITVDSIN